MNTAVAMPMNAAPAPHYNNLFLLPDESQPETGQSSIFFPVGACILSGVLACIDRFFVNHLWSRRRPNKLDARHERNVRLGYFALTH